MITKPRVENQSICISFENALNFSIIMYYCCQTRSSCLLLKGHKFNWWKGEFAELDASSGEMVDRHLPKCDHSLPLIVGKSFTGGGRGLHSERVICQSSWHWSLVVWSVSSWVQLIFSSRITCLHLRPAPNYGNYAMYTQSGHHVVNFSTWGFNICVRHHRGYISEYYL